MFELINELITLALFLLGVFLGKAGFEYFIGLPVLYILATMIPNLAKLVRRLHDTNHSGWWLFISIVPFGGIFLLVLTVRESDPGENRFGPNPKAMPAVAGVPGMGYLAPPLS